MDTHIFFWAISSKGSANLNKQEIALIENTENTLYVSSASFLEMSIKYAKGKWLEVGNVLDEHKEIIRLHDFKEITPNSSVCIKAGKLTKLHSDPFDCLIAAQAIHDKLSLMSRDKVFQQMGVKLV